MRELRRPSDKLCIAIESQRTIFAFLRITSAAKLAAWNAHTVVNAGVEKDTSMNCPLAVAPIRILVVDDHCVVREGLTILLDRDDGTTYDRTLDFWSTMARAIEKACPSAAALPSPLLTRW